MRVHVSNEDNWNFRAKSIFDECMDYNEDVITLAISNVHELIQNCQFELLYNYRVLTSRITKNAKKFFLHLS